MHKVRSVMSAAVNNVVATADIAFVTEWANWTVHRLTSELAGELNTNSSLRSRVVHHTFGLRHSLIHFTSFGPRFLWSRPLPVHKSNRTVWSVHHLLPGYEKYAVLGGATGLCDRIHTSCQATKQALVARGVPEEFIVVLPLGINTGQFNKVQPSTRTQLREKHSVPDDHVVIGSFQKDGLGWGSGDRPKYEKGPDLLIAAARELAQSYPVTVLLTGPARGYVKRALDRHNIPFIWVGFLPTLHEVASYYQMCDVYMISSRIEGGPLSLLEAWASGVPVVSTPVGMVPDVAQNNNTVLMTKTFSGQELAEKTAQVLSDLKMRQQLVSSSQRAVQELDWKELMPGYVSELYKPLLES